MKKSILVFFFLLLLINPLVLSDQNKWENTQILSSESTTFSYRANIVTDENNTIHIVWKDKSDILNAGNDWDLFYKYTLEKNKWSETELVTPESINDSNCLALTIDSENTLHLSWKDKSDILDSGPDWDVFYKSKPMNGNWTDTVLISKNSMGVVSCPAIAVDKDDTVHIAYADTCESIDGENDADIIYLSKEKNKEWSDKELVSRSSDNDTIDPYIAVDDYYTVHVVWYEEKSKDNLEIVYCYKTERGDWGLEEIVSTGSLTSSSDPTIGIDSKQTLHLVWNDKTNLFDNGNDYDILYRSKENQKEWGPIELISKTSDTNCKWPFLVIDKKDRIQVAWADQLPVDDSRGDYDIFYTLKTDKSQWEPIELVSITSTYDSNWPRFIIDYNDTLHMTWWDEQPSRWIIYYSSKPVLINEKVTDSPGLSVSIFFCLIPILITILKRKKYQI